MAKGEAVFNSKKVKVAQFESSPLPVKEYSGKLLPGFTVEKADGQGKLPYVKGRLVALKSATKKGGKDRTIQLRFWTNTTVGEGKKVSAVQISDQIVALMNALGKSFTCPVIKAKKMNEETEKLEPVQILDPNKLVKLLEGMVGKSFKFISKNEKDNRPGNETLWPKVDRFIAAGGEEADEDSDEEDEDEEEDSEDEDESDDEDSDDDSDDEDSDDEDEDEDEEEDDDSEDEDESEDDEDDEDSEDEDEDEDEDSDDEDDDEEEDDENEEPVKKKGKKAPAKKVTKKKAKK